MSEFPDFGKGYSALEASPVSIVGVPFAFFSTFPVFEMDPVSPHPSSVGCAHRRESGYPAN